MIEMIVALLTIITTLFIVVTLVYGGYIIIATFNINFDYPAIYQETNYKLRFKHYLTLSSYLSWWKCLFMILLFLIFIGTMVALCGYLLLTINLFFLNFLQ